MLQLVIGNKNYSSWSMRPWVLMKHAGIEFEEVMARFDGFGPHSQFKTRIARVSPAGRVPVLIDGDLAIWDSLAIAEYLAERFPDRRLWPLESAPRARARSLSAEMHAGFAALREHFAMNIEAALPEIGARVMRDQPAAAADVARIVSLWSDALEASGGPMLFGVFGIVDAFYAPVVTRFQTYRLPRPPGVDAYIERLLRLPSVAAWIDAASREHDFLAFDEPYREAPAAPR